jgi:hypothetical protein
MIKSIIPASVSLQNIKRPASCGVVISLVSEASGKSSPFLTAAMNRDFAEVF